MPQIKRFSGFKEFVRFNNEFIESNPMLYFSGCKKTIDALFQMNQARYDMQKHRIIYKCSAVSQDFGYAPGGLQMGDINRIE
jgi:hypothetical protein